VLAAGLYIVFLERNRKISPSSRLTEFFIALFKNLFKNLVIFVPRGLELVES